jgi:hypothetical protein
MGCILGMDIYSVMKIAMIEFIDRYIALTIV